MHGDKVRRGFTLVELLIVIVVIGILSAMMMLSSTEAVSSAKAAKIISDMRNIKTAALEWYMDSMDSIVNDNKDGIYWIKVGKKLNNVQDYLDMKNGQKQSGIVKKYISSGASISLNEGEESSARAKAGGYAITDCGQQDGKKRREWYVVYCIDNDDRLKQKLAARAKSAGLLNYNKPDAGFFDGVSGGRSNCVFMKIIAFE